MLNQAEFATAMQRLGFETQNPLRVFHFLDKDYSGEICFAEFKAIMRGAATGKNKRKEPKSVLQRLGSNCDKGGEQAGQRSSGKHKKLGKQDRAFERIHEDGPTTQKREK